MNLTELKTETRVLGILICTFLLITIVFAFLGFCSFPISDDFIMAGDLHKGFFWALHYWLGYWLSSWTTAALELSIPLSFGFYNYGLAFFLFVASSLLFSSLFVFRMLLGKKQEALAAALLFFVIYLIFVPSASEIIYWNIGALAYSLPFAGMLFFIALHERVKLNLKKIRPGPERLFLIFFLIILAAGFFYIWKVIRISRFISILDQVFPPAYVYVYWACLIAILIVLFFAARRFYFLNHCLIAVFAFLVVGQSPQTAVFLLGYSTLYLAYDWYHNRRGSQINIFVFLAVSVSVFMMMKMPGTTGRISLTNPDMQKDVQFYLNANEYLFKTHFLSGYLGAAYFLIFLLGLIFRSVFSKEDHPYRKDLFLWFFLAVFCLHLEAVVLFHFSNGHFPLRLSCNFIALNFLLFFAAGLTYPISQKHQEILKKNAVILSLASLIVLLLGSPNLSAAIREIWTGEAVRFRWYKLSQFETIRNCPEDTCAIPYQKFNLQLIPEQHFIFPDEKGFVLSHKLFISRYFEKEYIYYDPKTLPKEKLSGQH